MKKLIISFLLVLSYVLAVGQNMPSYWVPTSGTNTYSTNITAWGNSGSYNNKIAFVRFTNANTGAATININGISAAPIRKWDGTGWVTLSSGDIVTDRDYRLSYDNTNGWFRLEIIPDAFGNGPLLMGVATNADAAIAPIFGSTDGHTIRIASGTIGFGPLDLSDVDATTGSLPATNISFSPTGGISTGNVQNALTEVDAEKTSHVWLDNEQTTNYTAVLTDVNKVIQMNSASALNFTVPPNASVAFPTGTYLVVRQKGAGTVTIVPGSGVTVTQPAGGTLDTPGQGLSVTLHKTGTNTWDLENGSAGGGGGGSVNSVSGTTNRVTSTGGTDPVIDISATFEALLGKVASPLSQFAATTSAQLSGVISDETGSGSLVFSSSPALTGTPTVPTASANTNNTQAASTAYADAKVADAINNSTTTIAPSQNAVFDALALKQNNFSNFYIVSTISALQTYISGLSSGVDVNVWFPAGTYSVTTAIVIANKGVVRIFGEGAILTNGLSTSSIFTVDDCTGIYIDGINVNMNANASGVAAFDIDGISGVARFHNIDVYNFGANGQYGFLLENVPTNSLAGTLSFAFPALEIASCNFYNEITSTSFDYNSNNAKGVGIRLVEAAEYYKITNCSFNYVNTGIWAGNGANGLIDQCSFLWCNARGLTSTGVVYFDNSSAVNGGKVKISDCKFNHNWSYSVWSDYSNAQPRPVHIDRCEFIANAITPIVINGSSQPNSTISNSFFDRANIHTSGANDPYAAVTERYISTNSSFTLVTSNQFYTGINGTVVFGTGVSDNQIIKNNVFASGLTLTSLTGTLNVVFGNTTNTAVNISNVQYQLDLSSSSIPSYSASGFTPSLSSNTNFRLGAFSSSTGGSLLTSFSSASNTAIASFFRSIQGGTAPSVANTVFSAAKHNGTTGFTDIAATEIGFQFRNNATTILEILGSGRTGFGVTTPTAIVHLKAGTATASTAPLKFTSGTNLTTPEAGAVEFDGTNYFVTSSTTRYTLAKTLTNTATLDFGSTAAGSVTDLTITVTGAADGDVVSIGVPNGSVPDRGSFSAWVSAANTVTVRYQNNDPSNAKDPASGTFRATVIKY